MEQENNLSELKLERQVTGAQKNPNVGRINLSKAELVEVYNHTPQVLLRKVIKVSITEDKPVYNSNKQIFLAEERNGNYWVIATENGTYWLLPKGNLKINTFNINTVNSLFECQGYHPEDTREFTLFKPARVSSVPSGQEWKLEERGGLNFGKASPSQLQSELGRKLKPSNQERSHLQFQIEKLQSRLKALEIEPKDLFLREFFFIDMEEALPGAFLPNGMRLTFNGYPITPLIPLNPILLDYFTPEDLVSKILFQPLNQSEEPEVRVILDLPFTSLPDDNQPENYHLFKNYLIKEENALSEVPVLEVWPHFRAEDWQSYYAFYYDAEYANETFQVSLPEAKENHSFTDGRGAYQITRLEAFPSFIKCQNKDKNLLGLILLKTPEEIKLTDYWKVGVDFGTSFTNVYINRKGAVGSLPLGSCLHLKVTEVQIDTRNPVLFEYFVPENFIPYEKPLPLSNVLTTRGKSDTSEGKERPIFDGRIYFPNPNRFNSEEDWIETNLNLKNVILTRLFLQHLALHITALATKNKVKQIQWCLSYPSAFSRTDKNTYVKMWQDLIKELQDKTGIIHICPEIDDLDYFRSESLAFAQYFADQEGHDLINTTCICMGNDTSDISIWGNNQLVHQCSIQLAGQDLFSQFLEMNPQFLVQKFEVDPNEWNELTEGKFNAKLDVWLRLESDNWLKKKRAFVEEDSDFQGLLRLITIGTAGLYYYVGMLLKVLHIEKKYSRSEITPVYLGGKGSRLLNWLAIKGRFDRHSKVSQLLSRMLSKGSGFNDTEEITRLSVRPEDEVACGLVLDKTSLKGLTKKDKDPLIAGEDCEVNGQPISWKERLEFEGDIQDFQIPELVQLPLFLDQLNTSLKELEINGLNPMEGFKPGVGLEPTYKNKLWRNTQRELTSVLRIKGDSENIRVEPPFILGLKALLRVLGKEWAGK